MSPKRKCTQDEDLPKDEIDDDREPSLKTPKVTTLVADETIPGEQYWHFMFERLRLYRNEHGTYNMGSSTYKSDVSLGRWATTQRQNYRNKKLSATRIQKLNSIGFEWGPKKAQWYKKFEELQSFQKENGHTMVKGRRHKLLYNWVTNQRHSYKRGSMQQDRLDLLNGIGFVWDVKEEWGHMYRRLQDFKRDHGHTDFSSIHTDESGDLAVWLRVQVLAQITGGLSASKQEMLEKIGVKWIASEETPLETSGKNHENDNSGMPADSELENKGVLADPELEVESEEVPLDTSRKNHENDNPGVLAASELENKGVPADPDAEAAFGDRGITDEGIEQEDGPKHVAEDAKEAAVHHKDNDTLQDSPEASLLTPPEPEGGPKHVAEGAKGAALSHKDNDTMQDSPDASLPAPPEPEGGLGPNHVAECTKGAALHHNDNDTMQVSPDASLSAPSETQPLAASNQQAFLKREDVNGDTREMVVEETVSASQAVGSVDLDNLTVVVYNLSDILEELRASWVIHKCEVYLKLMIKRASKGRQVVAVDIDGEDAFSRLVPLVDAFVDLLDVSREEDVTTFLKCERFLNFVKKEARKAKDEAATSSTEQPRKKKRKIKMEEV